MAASGALRFTGGHTETVLSVALTSADNRVVSGGESGELSIWSLDGNIIDRHKITDDDDLATIVCSRTTPNIFYAGCGTKLYTFDTRHRLSDPVQVFNCAEDEINKLALNAAENHIAVADDSGNVTVINICGMKVYKTLRKHTNICASVSFASNKSADLYSAGYDSQLIQWNYSRSRSACIVDMKDLGETPDDVESFLVSPPFVHSLAVSASGAVLACATENALVHVFDNSKRLLQYRQTLHGHTQGVSDVHLPEFTDDRYIVSGGNDGRICFWDLGDDVVSPRGSREKAMMNGGGEKKHHATSNGDHAAAAAVGQRWQQQPKHTIENVEKINCIASGTFADKKFIVVADNTSCPVLYQFPS